MRLVHGCNIFSHASRTRWVIPLIKAGYRRRLKTEDLFTHPSGDDATRLGDGLEAKLKASHQGGSAFKLPAALFKCFGRQLFIAGVVNGVEECFLR